MEPVWAPDGHTIYYRSGTRVMAASLATNGDISVTERKVLFDGPYAGHAYHQNFDVMPDGQTFVMLEPPLHDERQPVVVVNWLAAVRRRLASQR